MPFTSFYDFFKGHTKEEILKAISLLNEYHKCMIYMKYGTNLNQLSDASIPYYTFYNVILKIRSILENANLDMVTPEKEVLVYKLFKGYSKKEIRGSIKALTSYEQEIFNLKLTNSSNWDIEKALILYFDIIPKLKLVLKENRINSKECLKTIYEIFDNNTKEEVDNVIISLTNDEQELLKLKYLENNWNDDLETEFREVLLPKIRRRLKANREYKNKKIPTLYALLGKHKREDIDEILNDLDLNEIHILFLRFGYDLDNPVSLYWDNSYILDYMNLLKKIKKLLKIKENEFKVR